MTKLILFNKPFQVLSQFTDRDRPEAPRPTLADFLSAPNYKVAGRLDFDSEGLLLLTNNGRVQQQIAHPLHEQWKTYWVQVEGQIDQNTCDKLESGITLKDGPTRPAKCRIIEPPALWERDPPIRHRLTVPDSWIELSISEGRNRQVRRMTAALGFPTLRLVRAAIGGWRLDSLAPGEHRIESMPTNPRTAGAPEKLRTPRNSS